MASNRPNNHNTTTSLQGRPLRPALASHRTAKTPLAPRLAAGPSLSTSTSVGAGASTNGSSSNIIHHNNNNNNTNSTFPRAATPKVQLAATATATAARNQHTPSLQPSLLEDTTTPASKKSLTDNVTPRSSARKSNLDSATNTPNTAHGTPSLVRPKLLSPTQSEPAVRRSRPDQDSRPHLAVAKPRSVILNGRDVVRGPSAPKSPAYLAASHHSHGPTTITKDTSAMFFRADQAKPQPEAPRRPAPPKKSSTFFYANGQSQSPARRQSPVRSVISRAKSPSLSVPQAPHSHHPSTSPMLSPPLSSVSSSSPFFPAHLISSPSFHPPSPPKESIHLSYRKGVSQIIGRTPSPAPSSISELHLSRPHQRQSSLGKPLSPNEHAKRQSLSSIDTSSPDQARAPSQQSNEAASNPSSASDDPSHASLPSGEADPSSKSSNEHRSLLPPMDQKVPSQVPDLAAEARRDRKVLDLEISNSSLLAINKSLEREIRKQKAELKRFRRLSRAGQFNVNAGPKVSGLVDPLSPLDEEDDGLPNIDSAVGRPSSPFNSDLDDADDYSDEDGHSSNSSAHPLTPRAQAAKDAMHRADDEERLKQDLDKHRELLLDTERMNQSLQRCLTWTEDLINHGKKALDYQVPSTEVKLGGRILIDDDDMDEEAASTQDGTETEDELPHVDGMVAQAMSGYFDARQGTKFAPSTPQRYTVREKDSGVGFGLLPHTPLMPSHVVEFGKPTPMRNTLLMSRANTGNKHSQQFLQSGLPDGQT